MLYTVVDTIESSVLSCCVALTSHTCASIKVFSVSKVKKRNCEQIPHTVETVEEVIFYIYIYVFLLFFFLGGGGLEKCADPVLDPKQIKFYTH